MASDINKENFGDDFLKSTAAIVASGISVLVAILISANLIVKHLLRDFLIFVQKSPWIF